MNDVVVPLIALFFESFLHLNKVFNNLNKFQSSGQPDMQLILFNSTFALMHINTKILLPINKLIKIRKKKEKKSKNKIWKKSKNKLKKKKKKVNHTKELNLGPQQGMSEEVSQQ